MSHAMTTLDLIERARADLLEAYVTSSASQRYASASMAALRAAAAFVASRPTVSRDPGPADVWTLVSAAAPELRDWAVVFAHSTGERLAVETGLARVSVREADDLVRDAEAFIELIGSRVGVLAPPPGLRLAAINSA